MSQNFLNKYVRHNEIGDIYKFQASFWEDCVWMVSLKTGHKYGHKPSDVEQWIKEGRYIILSPVDVALYV